MLNSVISKVNQVVRINAVKPVIDWEDTLNGMRDVDALHEIKEQLAQLEMQKKTNLLHKLDLVFGADTSSYKTVQKLTHDFLIVNEENEEVRHEIETAVYEYLRQLYTSYTNLIVAYQQLDTQLLNSQQINLLMARYLNAAFMMAKWRYFDAQSAPVGLWSNVHQIIKISEQLSMMNTQLFLYDFKNIETSIAAILKRGFLLDTLQKESYSQFQIELTDRVLKLWSGNPVISNHYTKRDEYQFFIHLEKDKRPQRIRGAKQHPNFRYWKTARLIDLIEQYLCAVDTGKSLAVFNLESLAAVSHMTALFKKLRVDWCVKGYKRQRRDDARISVDRAISVSQGLDAIASRLQSAARSKNRQYNGLGHINTYSLITLGAETWKMQEESDRGFSVVLSQPMRSWVKSGVLVAYADAENPNKILLAEVKSVRKHADGSYRIGLLKISGDASAITISKIEKNTVYQAVEGYTVDDGQNNLTFSNQQAALFIDNGRHHKPQIIMARHDYKRASRYRLNLNDKSYNILAGEVTHMHRQWVAFEAIK